ncbi:MAG TPA: TIGR00730 family Rossman fold protein [Microvirga sp.]|jgi:hypothetical protein|nr:TIGR00730 family Rossman fold protein [Microvirga sp.]
MRICVYAGSNPGNDPAYREAAGRLGRTLARRSIELVYGGGHTGLMGAVADACLQAGGRVTGVMPGFLVEKEIAHRGLSDLRVVCSMHERKTLMADLSEGFIALPGGIGTFEELFEVWTWGQLGQHAKPCGLLNVGGFYDGLSHFLAHVAWEGFLKEGHRRMLQISTDPDRLLDAFAAYEPPATGKWLEVATT